MVMSQQWSSTTLVAADPKIVFCDLDNERVLLDIDSSRYFAMNKVSIHVWEAIAEPTSVADLQANLMQRFNVDADRCRRDLEALLTKLSQSALIRVQHVLAA